MLRSYLLVNCVDLDEYLPELERWLYKDHAPDTMSQLAPILDRYVTYRAVTEPKGSAEFCVYNWRMTEHWWRENPFRGVMGHGSAIAEQWTKNYHKAVGLPTGEEARTSKWEAKAPAFIFVTPRINQDFKGNGLTLADGNTLRWVTVFRYPEGVSVKEGDDWYINIHAKEVAEQLELKRFFSFNAIEPSSMVGPFVRVSEMWYENGNAWRKAVLESKYKYTKPAWAKCDQYPYLEPGVDFVSIFLLERPECDFLRDYRGYLTTA
jgi:hypothetical protein